jgi:beta-galactosidase
MRPDRNEWLSSHRLVQLGFLAALAAVACGSGAQGTGSDAGPDATTGATTGITTGATTSATNGATTGATNGATTGATNGATTGATNGATTGATNGATTGATNGATTGATNGATTGATTGATNGATTGATNGATTGATNGTTTGATNGATTGATSGTTTATDGGMTPLANRVRTIIPFDSTWLFNPANATGAQTTTFADKTWRSLNVPHDWSIEGATPPSNPFTMAAATTGRGAYAPSGVVWYRKHFTLDQSYSGKEVYIDFDGIMENSTVYINGTELGHHPYGYMGVRYDMTKSVVFGGADNVIAVESDTSIQPAERYYTGAGIYRHVRLLVTDPVHVNQWATFVQVPSPTATSATVNVTTSVLNSGTTSQSVTVQGIVSGPTNMGTSKSLTPVTTAAQTIAAGAAATFTFTVPVTNPALWDLDAPNMYQLLTNVQVGGATVDDDVTPFGIRDLVFNNGLTLNGKSIKLQGIANHQDYHGLGMAVPQRAMQRRLAALKSIGVNAFRVAHNPPSPDFLDLTDVMGILVLDEFTDVWSDHKYTDVGDYAAYFNEASTTPTGLPAPPSSAKGTKWWEVDFSGFIMRDRNHPSVAMYSMGNEIHDSITSRTPILMEMVAISHELDPPATGGHNDTQALLNPATSGDYPGTMTSSLVDVWGDNYDVTTCTEALKQVTTKSGVITEEGFETSTWTTVMATSGLVGEFIWTGTSYLGEAVAPLGWPTIGNSTALLDSLGDVQADGTTWQKEWGAAGPKAAPGPGLSVDHSTIVTDWNDIAFVRATVGGTAATPVTFAITGPGSIVAVDSASMTQETFRGLTRNAYAGPGSTNGSAFALVQATGAGTITVTATGTGLTNASVTITATAGTFVPCSGTCD